jgi:uroporphyrinogen III methyltransferase/synthase
VRLDMKNKFGKVYLVGAGPGDEGLITVKALECIATADVIVYDELANSVFLKHAKVDAEQVYAGKKGGDHHLTQDQIEALLVKYAKEGKSVCRLKGGDPFVFGRGGEEAETLFKNGIGFEIVPGISSAVAVPAYAGISITQRGLTSGVAIFTGHEDPTKETSDMNWKSIARLKTTLVFLMGMKNLPLIVDQLIRNGLDSQTPVAIIHRGTTPRQATVTGQLNTIVKIVESSGLTAPSVIVVGKVVGMREYASWFEGKPLFGKWILVTRSRKQVSKQTKLLRDLGAFVYEFPTIEIESNADAMGELDASINSLSNYDWVIFTSANGVETFFDRVKKLDLDARALATTKICAIGTATRDKLAEYFITADLIPEQYVAESILEAFKGKVEGKRILLPRADLARDVLPEGLKKEGAEVKVIDVYKTTVPLACGCELKNALDNIDMVTFASSSTVDNFVEILADDFAEYKDKIKAASIGPVTSKTLKKHGMNISCEAKEYNIPGLIDRIVEYYGEK